VIAVDVGVLAWAVNRWAPEHPRAARALESLANGERPWALPVTVAHEFLRLVTHPHRVARALARDDAWGFLAGLLRSPSGRLLTPTDRHAQAIEEVLALLPADAGLPAGFDTAVLLREHRVRELLSPDSGMRAFPFLDVRDPTREPGWAPDAPPRRRYRRLAPRTPSA
jgi:predicted nucleic acid-binding protein